MKKQNDKLQMDGVFSKGYGIIYKFVMLDSDLSIEAKAIFAYLCSYAGNGTTAFPSRSTILFHLQIGKDAYINHINELIDKGYILCKQEKNSSNKFSHNIYTIQTNPARYSNAVLSSMVDKKKAYSRVFMPGMAASGIGFIPKLIMLDKRLSIKAKGIYAYFCAFAGTAGEAFPKKDLILYHLGMCDATYTKHYKQLIATNYIKVHQERINGIYSVNNYYLCDDPSSEDNEMPETLENKGFLPTLKKPDTEKPDTELSDTEKSDTKNPDTNNNKININNFDNNNPSIYETEGQEDDIQIDELLRDISEGESIPDAVLNSEDKRISLVHSLSEWETFSNKSSWHGYEGRNQHDAYTLAVNCIVDMLAPKKHPMQFCGTQVSQKRFADELCRHIDSGRDPSGKEYHSIANVIMDSVNSYREANATYPIKNQTAYMKSIIWNQMIQGNAQY